MNILEKHEIFEMEVLDKLNSARILDFLVFGGGSMLRLCHEMKRFSVDLDFWKTRDIRDERILAEIEATMSQEYDVTDSQLKYFTILVEVRSPHFPRRLKIEIRRELREWDYEHKIAFSKFSTLQVLVKAHTLKQTLINKIHALLDRGEIRDAFDIEFILRKGVELPSLSKTERAALLKQLEKFKTEDFKVILGSLLEPDIRKYYIEQQFSFLREKLM